MFLFHIVNSLILEYFIIMEKEQFVLLAATNNEHKLTEIRQILSPYGIKVLSLRDKNIAIDVEENGTSYKENALIKANALSKFTSMPLISDDSGIEVEALNNEPGIHTARYAKQVGGYNEAFKIIIEECKNKNNYNALFNCDIALMNYKKEPIIFEGRVPGKISPIPTSEGTGFGFDPIFISNETGKTNASLTVEEKNIFSARAKALQQLINYLKEEKIIL